MKSKIDLRKMKTCLSEDEKEISYSLLSVENKLINITKLVGKTISLEFLNEIHCVVCGKKIKKTYGGGSCYPCFMEAPENSPCIIRPELCEAHLGKGRDPQWEQVHHNCPHYVYLAKSSAIKVGVTRADQIPTRWIDQGASEGLILAKTPHRNGAGRLEVYLKDFFTDRTNWQRMLKNQICSDSLVEIKESLYEKLPNEFSHWITRDSRVLSIPYPVLSYPQKVKSLKFDKNPFIEGKLEGIKGQYLIFEEGNVLNIRSHSGYLVNLCY